MDSATSVIIILVFVFSIFGAATNKKVEPQSYAPSPETVAAPQTIHTNVDTSSVPSHVFESGQIEGLTFKLKSFILRYAKRVPPWEAQNIAENIVKYSNQYDVNPRLVTALIARESRFNKFSVSSSGAQGLGQLLPATAAGLGISDPFDIEDNVKGTVRYFRSMLDRFSGSDKVVYAIAGYFEGPNSVKRNNGFKLRSKSYIEDIIEIYYKI